MLNSFYNKFILIINFNKNTNNSKKFTINSQIIIKANKKFLKMSIDFFTIDKEFQFEEDICFKKNFAADYALATDSAIQEEAYDKIAPISATAVMLSKLLNKIIIPSGLIHTGQNIQAFGFIYPDEQYKLAVQVTRASLRSKIMFVSFEMQLNQSKDILIKAITSVAAPVEE